MSNTPKRGTKFNYTHYGWNGGKPFVVSYFKKVRNNDYMVEVLFPHEVGGGGFHKVDRTLLTPVEK